MRAPADPRPKLRRAAIEGGMVMVAGALIGIGGQVYGMIQSFRKIEEMKAPTPGDLAVGVTSAFRWLEVGGVIFVAGAIVLVVALVQLSRVEARMRERTDAD